MKKIRSHKWIEGIACDDPTCTVAIRTLKTRLRAVEHYLPLAAKKADKDDEYVHNLRIWTRRATVALKLYDEILPHRRARWIKKQLEQIRRAAGDARDYDVLAESMAHDTSHQVLKPCLKRIRGKREKAQKPLIAVNKRLKYGNRFHRQIKKLLHRLRRDSDAKISPFSEWAYTKMRPIVKNFLEAAPGQEADLTALHQFRIRGKDLRYAMELLAGAFPPDFRGKLYPLVESMQARLGKINDLATSQARLQQLLDDTDNAAEDKHLLHLLTQEQSRLERALSNFLDWCPPHVDTLRADFSAMLKPRLGAKVLRDSLAGFSLRASVRNDPDLDLCFRLL